MGDTGRGVVLGLAASLAVLHTAIGVDHALPFVVLARVQRWSLARTLAITAACGAGHIASAVLIGLAAVAFGFAVEQLTPFEAVRGRIGLGVLIAFGLGYALLGLVRLWRQSAHRHAHAHHDGTLHDHHHGHADEHVHLHDDTRRKTVTAWTLFVVLVFGPCEVLVPLLLAPGVTGDRWLLVGIVAVFGGLTVLTMLVMVTIGLWGARLIDLERHLGPKFATVADIVAGLAVAGTGFAVGVFGL